MNTQVADNHQVKVIGQRLMETLVIGGVVLYGVVQVLESKSQSIIETQRDIVKEVKAISAEQARRTVIVEESWQHINDNSKHK